MKPCSQVRGFGTNFHNYVLPLYSLFGNVNGTLYVCIRPHYRVSRLKVWNGYRWVDTTTKDHPDIRHFIIAFMNSADFISEEPVKCRRDTRAIASMLPREKKHPQPMYGSKSGCYSQARVDGQAITSHGKKIPNLYSVMVYLSSIPKVTDYRRWALIASKVTPTRQKHVVEMA